jgi:uncharacterized protein
MAETVLISGASGLVGKQCLHAFRARGYDVLKLVRHLPTDPDEVRWSTKDGVKLDANRGIDHVVHLAGEPIFSAWTKEKKKRIFESRVHGTRAIAEFCASRVSKPKTLVAASAIGIYGDRGDEVLTESSAPGTGFLADVARAWEAATAPAKSAGVRVVNLRIGVVLSKDGGALAMMKLPFELGLGGRIGSGKQWMSWITLDDLVDVIVGAVENASLSGVYNCTAPEPVTNRDFAKALGYVLNRPAVLPVPGFVLNRLPGDMASETFFSSERVIPQRLLESGFAFKYPRLIEALAAIFQKDLQEQIGA